MREYTKSFITGPWRTGSFSSLPNKVKFYCENCGKRVHPRDRICPYCGRFFSQVRCPSCGFRGTTDVFLSGCPQCGYLGKTDQPPLSADDYETAYVEPVKREVEGPSTGLILALVAGVGFLLAAAMFWLGGRN
ncbi:MAG: hypothetical protein GW949_06805 [Spirochaetales bacterium]|nr:hypothetical protein [Spirochaetales bacterium]